jgi:hypothetical protein
MYISISMRDAQTVKACVSLIAQAPIVEGVEGVEFSPEQLAGEWAADYLWDSGTERTPEAMGRDTIEAFVGIVADHCRDEQYGGPVEFDENEAAAHAEKIVAMLLDEEKIVAMPLDE